MLSYASRFIFASFLSAAAFACSSPGSSGSSPDESGSTPEPTLHASADASATQAEAVGDTNVAPDAGPANNEGTPIDAGNAACDAGSPAESHQAQWQSLGYANYHYHYTAGGFQLQEDVIVTVVAGAVTKVEATPATTTDSGPAPIGYTIDRLFYRIQFPDQAYEQTTNVTYDAQLFYPTAFTYLIGGPGGEFETFTVSDLTRDP